MTYRNHPGGMNRMSENITATSRPIALEDVIAIGNRAQRRFAKKKLVAIQRREPKLRRMEHHK